MNDQNNNSNPTPIQPNPVTSAPVVPPAFDPASAGRPAAPAVPAADPNADLQALSKDLENLAKEAVASAPAAAAPVAPVPAAPAPMTAPEPVVVPPVAAAPAEPTEAKPASTEAPVTIYTTASCPFCKAEKEYLTSQKLTYVEKNVEEDTESLKEMLSVSDNFAGVPVTVLKGPKGKKVVKGFTQAEFAKELADTGLIEAPAVEPAAPAVEAPAAPMVNEPVVPPAFDPASAGRPAAPVMPAEPTAAAPPQVPDLK